MSGGNDSPFEIAHLADRECLSYVTGTIEDLTRSHLNSHLEGCGRCRSRVVLFGLRLLQSRQHRAIRQSIWGAFVTVVAMKRMERSPSPCPDENVMAAYLEGSILPEEREQVEKHAALCWRCIEVIAFCVRIEREEEEEKKRH